MWHREPPLPDELRDRLERLGHQAGAAVEAMRHDVREESHGRWRRDWHFPTEQAAARWNDEWDAVLAERDAIHPALVAIGGAAIPDLFLDALARLCGVILSEEVHAGTPIPYMTRGWSYGLGLEHILHADTQAALPQPVVVKLVGEVRGQDGDVYWTADATRIYPSDLLPRTLVALWSTRAFSALEEDYAPSPAPRERKQREKPSSTG